MKNIDRFPLVLVLVTTALLALLACGCTGYRLGATLPPGIHSIHVPTFVNATDKPQLEYEATSATIRELQKDGTLKVTDRDLADAILEVRIIDYKLTPVRYRETQRTTADEYRVTLTTSIVLRKRAAATPPASPQPQAGADPSIVLERKAVIGDVTFLSSGGLSSAERAALPKASENLAQRIVREIVEYW